MSFDVTAWSTRTLLQVPSTVNATEFQNEFTNFSLSFAGGLALGLVLAIVAMGVGLVLALFGSRLFKYTLFMIAFLFGAALGFFIVVKLGGATDGALVAAAILGLILGSLAVKVWKASLFLIGAGCGFILWTVFKALFPGVLNTDVLLYGVLVAVCVVLGLIAVKMEKVWLLFGTPLVGTFLFMQGIDYFLDPHLNVFQLLDSNSGCTFTGCYVLYAAVFGGSLFGFFIQYRYTSEYGKKRRERESVKREAKREYEDRDRNRRKYRRRRDSASDDD